MCTYLPFMSFFICDDDTFFIAGANTSGANIGGGDGDRDLDLDRRSLERERER